MSQFDDIKPTLLLFLHELESIVIVNQIRQSRRVMTRSKPTENDLYVLHDGLKSASWMVVKQSLSSQERFREGVDCTELALALPMNYLDLDISWEPEFHLTYAYLPLRDYGFKFLIQASSFVAFLFNFLSLSS